MTPNGQAQSGADASFVKISIDGRQLDDFSAGAILDTVTITQELNKHWYCEVHCRQTEDERFPIEQAMGKALKASTFDADGAEHVMFQGFVLDGEIDYEVSGSFGIQMIGVTKSYLMDLTPRQAYYRNKTMTAVTQEIVENANLSVTGVFDDTRSLSYVQYGETDFSFLNRIVDDVEGWMRPTADGLEVFNAFQPGAQLQWRGEDNGLVRFKFRGKLAPPSMNGAHYDSVAMQSKVFSEVQDDPQFYDSMAQFIDAVKSESASQMPSGYVAQRSRARTLDEYEKLLKKESRRAMGGAFTGYGVSRNQELLPGNEVEIQGTLDAQGTYGVTKVVHSWAKQGYSNEFWCAPWKTYTNPAAPRTKPWFGTVPARVVDNNDGSIAQGQVRIQYYWQEQTESIFCRWMTPHAGGDRGFLFLPEVGDEVWVTFEDGDPERPRVIGCAWNGADHPPREEFWGADVTPNDVKRIVTKSGHRITIVDKEGKETICLATPKHVKVMMTESSNESGRATLTLQCDGDIVINAGGRIHMKSAFYSREVG